MSNILTNTNPLPEAIKIQIMHLLIEEMRTIKHEQGSELAKINEVFSKMEVHEMVAVLANATGFEVSCNIDQLIQAVWNVNEKSKVQNEIIWLLQHGANNPMINRLYPSDADPSKLAILRSSFCESNQRGREKQISKLKDIDRIQKDWYLMKAESDNTFENLKTMQYKWPHYNIAQIWLALVP